MYNFVCISFVVIFSRAETWLNSMVSCCHVSGSWLLYFFIRLEYYIMLCLMPLPYLVETCSAARCPQFWVGYFIDIDRSFRFVLYLTLSNFVRLFSTFFAFARHHQLVCQAINADIPTQYSYCHNRFQFFLIFFYKHETSKRIM